MMKRFGASFEFEVLVKAHQTTFVPTFASGIKVLSGIWTPRCTIVADCGGSFSSAARRSLMYGR